MLAAHIIQTKHSLLFVTCVLKRHYEHDSFVCNFALEGNSSERLLFLFLFFYLFIYFWLQRTAAGRSGASGHGALCSVGWEGGHVTARALTPSRFLGAGLALVLALTWLTASPDPVKVARLLVCHNPRLNSLIQCQNPVFRQMKNVT